MVKQKTIDKYTKFIGKNFGCIHVIETIKSSSTIPKGSTSKAIVDGNGVHLKFKRDGDIVKSAQ